MERLSNIHDSDLSLAGFERFPIWTWDDAQEGYHPITGVGTFPSEYPTLFIRATFTTTSGHRITGYLMGLESFYGFGIFYEGKDYLINLNLHDLAVPVLRSLSLELGENVLPLCYSAEVVGCSPIKGTFEKV